MTRRPRLKLSYFDFHGGRGEPARVAFAIGGIAFEDDRIPFSEWAARKRRTPLGGVPVLRIDDVELTQSNAILRYAGRLAGLVPDDALQAAFCDEVLDAVEDATTRVVATFGMPDPDALKQAREALVAGPIALFLRGVAGMLGRGGGEWFADGRFTVADLKAFSWIRHLRSGNLDHVPADLVERQAPALLDHTRRVRQHPGVAAYYDALGVE